MGRRMAPCRISGDNPREIDHTRGSLHRKRGNIHSVHPLNMCKLGFFPEAYLGKKLFERFSFCRFRRTLRPALNETEDRPSDTQVRLKYIHEMVDHGLLIRITMGEKIGRVQNALRRLADVNQKYHWDGTTALTHCSH